MVVSAFLSRGVPLSCYLSAPFVLLSLPLLPRPASPFPYISSSFLAPLPYNLLDTPCSTALPMRTNKYLKGSNALPFACTTTQNTFKPKQTSNMHAQPRPHVLHSTNTNTTDSAIRRGYSSIFLSPRLLLSLSLVPLPSWLRANRTSSLTIKNFIPPPGGGQVLSSREEVAVEEQSLERSRKQMRRCFVQNAPVQNVVAFFCGSTFLKRTAV